MSNNLSIAVLLLGVFGLTPANASPVLDLPEVSATSVPYVHFAGMAPAEGSAEVVTVAEGKELIITLANADPGLTLRIGGTTLAPSWLTEAGPNNSLSKGTARIRVTGGSTVSIHNDRGHAIGYYVQGFYVVPGSPYRSFTARCPEECSTTGHTVFTAESERPFLVQTTAVSGSCDVYIDDTLAIPHSSLAAWVGYTNRGMIQGRATLVVPADASLKVIPGSCDYYFDGKYLSP